MAWGGTVEIIKGRLRSWRGTSSRTFFVYPAVTLLLELLVRRRLRLHPLGLLLMLWGYAQYRLVGAYLMRTGRGSGYGAFSWNLLRSERAATRAPSQLVTTGPYALTRNPMYTGHVIFMAGLVLATRSPVALMLAAYHAYWLHGRALEDEEALCARFGNEYEAYRMRVGRWLP
jgi:protein-S-isoprenylcysteine O-methyltransferase Ste14